MNREHSDTFSALKGLMVKGRGDELVTRACLVKGSARSGHR